MPPYAFEVIASNIFAIIHNPQIYTTTQMHTDVQENKCTHTDPFSTFKMSFPQLRGSAEAMYPDGTDDAPCSPLASEG